MGDSQSTQNIQINKAISENKKCDFYFTEKMKQTFGCFFYFMEKTKQTFLSNTIFGRKP